MSIHKLILLTAITTCAVICRAQPSFTSVGGFTTSTIVASSFISDAEGWVADDGGKLWHTSNSGQQWQNIYSGVKLIAVSFTGQQNGFALTSEAAYKTNDGGSSWSIIEVENPLPPLSFSGSSNGLIRGWNVLYLTADGGTTWDTASTGDLQFTTACLLDPSTIIAASLSDSAGEILWRSTDGGLTWANTFSGRRYVITTLSKSSAATAWAAGYYNLAGAAHQPVILKSTDGGLSWNNVYQNVEAGGRGESFVDIRFRNEQEGMAITAFSENVITTDGGQTWSLLYDTDGYGLIPLFGYYHTLAGNTNLYVCGQDGIVYRW